MRMEDWSFAPNSTKGRGHFEAAHESLGHGAPTGFSSVTRESAVHGSPRLRMDVSC